MNDDEMNDEVERLLPRHISDESAAVLCDFIAELSMVADSRYLCRLRRYREENRTMTNPDRPWECHRG